MPKNAKHKENMLPQPLLDFAEKEQLLSIYEELDLTLPSWVFNSQVRGVLAHYPLN